MQVYIDLQDLYFGFPDLTVISGTTDDPYDADKAKGLTPGYITDIISRI
jgi:hypothetical protein